MQSAPTGRIYSLLSMGGFEPPIQGQLIRKRMVLWMAGSSPAMVRYLESFEERS
jgi:hypothetical protein